MPIMPARGVIEGKRMRTKAFALIELLVVIVILAVLAAVLFPVFAMAREKAHQTTCASNLRQIGLAIAAYTGDNGGFIVPWLAEGYGPDSTEGLPRDVRYLFLDG